MLHSLFVVGSINVDLLMNLPAIPREGETVTGGVFSQAQGGKGANAAVAAARSFAQSQNGAVAFIGAVGDDAAGLACLLALDEEGIETSGVLRLPQTATGTAFILLDNAGRNAISVASGANAALTANKIRQSKNRLQGAKWLLLGNEIAPEATLAALEIARDYRLPTLLNYAPALPQKVPLCKEISVLVVNETEAAQLANFPVETPEQAKQAACELQKRGPKTVIVTLGAQGLVVASENRECWHQSAFKVSPVDTTAAGDTFCGALAARLCEGAPFEEAVRFGAGAAALCVTRRGAQPSIPTRSEIEKFLALQPH